MVVNKVLFIQSMILGERYTEKGLYTEISENTNRSIPARDQSEVKYFLDETHKTWRDRIWPIHKYFAHAEENNRPLAAKLA